MSINIHFLFRIIFTYLLIYTVYLFLQFQKPRYLKADVKATRYPLKTGCITVLTMHCHF